MRSSHPPPPPPSSQRLLLSATIILSLASHGNSFQNYHPTCRSSMTPSLAHIPRTRVKMSLSSSSSFQQARLEEQLRLSKQQTGSSDDVAIDDVTSQEVSLAISDDGADSTGTDASEEARNMLALENDALGPDEDGMPFAPMMTFQKYLTMQDQQNEKRVKVTIRYSAEAGLRPFFLTVANQIKSVHPDVSLEKRILPPVGSDAGGAVAIFEVIVDGKIVTGKKKTKMLKVSSQSKERGGGEDENEDGDGKSEGKKKNDKSTNKDANTPDIAGGRSIFVSMQKLDLELAKARKRRRPNTMYVSKEDALRGAVATTSSETGGMAVQAGVDGNNVQESGNVVQSIGTTEAVMRLEKLKAMSAMSKM